MSKKEKLEKQCGLTACSHYYKKSMKCIACHDRELPTDEWIYFKKEYIEKELKEKSGKSGRSYEVS